MNLEMALETPNFTASENGSKWWPIRPCTGTWWVDVFWLAFIVALNQHIIPSIFGNSLPLDLLTPWLVISFVVGTPMQGYLIWFLGSMFMETSVNAPRGLYLCAYWIILSVLLLTRRTLSWKLVVPWLVTFFVSSFWLSNFETVMIFLKQDAKQLDFGYFFGQLVRVILTCVVGMAMAQPWMLRFKGDRVRGERSRS